MTNVSRKYRTTRDIVVPKGSRVVYVGRMKKDMSRLATALVRWDHDKVYEWIMHFDDALEAGLIEEVK